jgi:hemerythrin
MPRSKRPFPAASLARIEEEHRQLSQWLSQEGSPRPHDSWVQGLSAFAEEARRHRELEEELIRHFGLEGLREHREAHRGVEAAIERLLHEARIFGDRGGPLMACELVASWLGHHQTAWDQVRPKNS